MKHYLTFEEFEEFVLREREGAARHFVLDCEDDEGYRHTIVFRDDWFQCRIILYTLPNTLDIGIIQEDIDNGWEENIKDVWCDITQTCGWRPYFLENKNLFN